MRHELPQHRQRALEQLLGIKIGDFGALVVNRGRARGGRDLAPIGAEGDGLEIRRPQINADQEHVRVPAPSSRSTRARSPARAARIRSGLSAPLVYHARNGKVEPISREKGALREGRPSAAAPGASAGRASGERRVGIWNQAGVRSRYEITCPYFGISLRLLMPCAEFLRSSYSLTTA